MTASAIEVRVSDDEVNPILHAGTVVSLRVSAHAQGFSMTGEAYSPAILRTIARQLTVWVRGFNANDRFRLEMCYYPVFTPANIFDPGASLWAQVGQQITLASGRLVAAQTLDDVAYAVRAVKVTAAGVPVAGNFEVYSWALKG